MEEKSAGISSSRGEGVEGRAWRDPSFGLATLTMTSLTSDTNFFLQTKGEQLHH